MSETKKLNQLETALYMLDSVLTDLSNREGWDELSMGVNWVHLIGTIKESQRHITGSLCHLRDIYEELHGEVGVNDRDFSKQETIGVLRSWSRKSLAYDSIIEALNLPEQEDYPTNGLVTYMKEHNVI
jgi:hypothetical protein